MRVFVADKVADKNFPWKEIFLGWKEIIARKIFELVL